MESLCFGAKHGMVVSLRCRKLFFRLLHFHLELFFQFQDAFAISFRLQSWAICLVCP